MVYLYTYPKQPRALVFIAHMRTRSFQNFQISTTGESLQNLLKVKHARSIKGRITWFQAWFFSDGLRVIGTKEYPGFCICFRELELEYFRELGIDERCWFDQRVHVS